MNIQIKMGAAVFACALSVLLFADTVAVPGGDIEYSGAWMRRVGDDAVLVFTNTSANNTFTVPTSMTAKAHLLLVGGGGAGGTVGQDIPRGAGGGGGAGGVSDRVVMLEAGSYRVSVGAGGRAAQTSVQSWVGNDGGSSSIACGADGYVASAKGGGGGGSVKIGGAGASGASGGGGAWYGAFLPGGTGMEGSGWSGGTPQDEDVGGGGGGASPKGSNGTGGADGHGGVGHASDITGVDVEYARGGRGGRRGDTSYAPADGVTSGSGGDGAVNGLGGRGADGLVVVRIEKVFEYKLVDVPTAPVYTNSFVWAEGASCVAFDLAQAASGLKDALASVVGATSVVCSVSDGGAVTNGLGHFAFTLALKDEYKWRDGSADGSVAPRTFVWRVKEPDVVGDITVEVSKTVDWFEGTNATLALEVHSTPESRLRTPKALVLGSLCYKHGLTPDVVKRALDTLAGVAEVDYSFFLQVSDRNDADLDNPVYHGHLEKGGTASGVPTADYSNMHGTLYAFYEYLDRARMAGTAYDYIVLSFDRALVATTFPGAHPHEAEVSRYIQAFYDRGAVVWMVDGEPAQCATLRAPRPTVSTSRTVNLAQTPWAPSPLVCLSAGGSHYWTTFSGYINYGNGASVGGESAVANYRALMGLFSPGHYAGAAAVYARNVISTESDSAAACIAKYNNAKGAENPNQVVYSDADKVAKALVDVVRPTVATLRLEDHVCLESGLKIAATEGYWTTNAARRADAWEAARTGWTRLRPDELTTSDAEGVRIALSNVTSEVWLKLRIGVFDTGRFLSSVDATYNERTGRWEKDPNNGPVRVKMTPPSGETVLAEDQATTAVEWAFEACRITGGVVWGEGDFVVNGFFTNEVSVAKGSSPDVLFRGAPGWAVNFIEVDGVVLDEANYRTNWLFGAVGADHDVRVGFTNVVVGLPPPAIGPVVEVYDGTGYAPETLAAPTFASGHEDFSNRWYMVYSVDPDADPADRSAWSRDGVITNVVVDADGVPQPRTVYARICLEQPGYEDGAVVPGWIGTNTVTILPRAIEVTFDDYVQTSEVRKTGGFAYTVTDGEILDGDALSSNDGRCTDYPGKGETAAGVIVGDGDFHVTSADGGTGNYVVTVVPGDYVYPDLDIVVRAPDIVKYYDALATGTVVSVVYPPDARTRAETAGAWGEWSGYTYNNGNVNRATRRTRTRSRTIEGSLLEIDYLHEGTSSPVPFAFTDAGVYAVDYVVSYRTVEIVETETAVSTRSNVWGSWGVEQTSSNSNDVGLVYATATGAATVTILPRTVTATAGSAAKVYDGTPLTQAAYVKDTADVAAGDQSGAGFVAGEGFASVTMTAGSAITLPGSAANTIDETAVTLKPDTRPGNYELCYRPGALVVTPNALTAVSKAADTVYDGTPNRTFGVTGVKGADGTPLDPSQYTIRYKRHPWEDYALDAPPAGDVDSGEYVVYYKVIGADGYASYEGCEVYRVAPRAVTMIADDAVKFYDGEPLATNAFTVAEASDPATEGFVNGEGVATVVMTPASAITAPGETANVIDAGAVAGWTFAGGLTEEAFRRNYVCTLVPGTLEVKAQARALWIVDHEDPGDGFVYLAFEPELLDGAEGADWVARFAEAGKFKVKYGRTRAEADACAAVAASLSDRPGHEATAEKVWLKVALRDIVRGNETVVEPQGFWRIAIDGPAKHLTDAEEDFGYGAARGGPALQGAAALGVLGTNGAVSVNTFGILKVEIPTTNTMVAVPWTWYSKIQRAAESIPVKKLVKTTNLEEGDMLYAPIDNDTYAAWMVERNAVTGVDGTVHTGSAWSAVQVVRVDGDGFGRMQFRGDDDADEKGYARSTRIARGNGLWLYRQKPLDASGNARPFWLYGQSVTTEVTTVISAPTGTNTVRSTMIGNPYAQDVVLNDLEFRGTIDSGDRIKLHLGEGVNRDLVYVAGKGWREYATRIVDGVKRSGYTYRTVVPAGTAFWYDRRGTTDLSIKWRMGENLKTP